MRVVAGTLRSRIIKGVEGMETRPTSDKVKGAIFSRIGPYFSSGTMLDLFAGSGGMGIEAYSRGFETIYFNDKSRKALQTIRFNVETMQMQEHAHIYQMDYMQMLKNMHHDKLCFDLIFIDPPYKNKCLEEILTCIDAWQLLQKQGWLICESNKEDVLPDVIGKIRKDKEAVYGITKVTYYRGE